MHAVLKSVRQQRVPHHISVKVLRALCSMLLCSVHWQATLSCSFLPSGSHMDKLLRITEDEEE